ncbi:MAG TPA: FkbM family methyltransferase [Spirochaetota bacterium]|nr:FkbM family methyltransferase [Spirochaetota bacterium]
MIKKILNKLKLLFTDKEKNKIKKISYSQSGEDIIIDFVFYNILRIDKPSYIDIGAHHPYYLSNTALFYKNGCKGINIEPNPDLIKLFYRYRKKDINLNIGISDKNQVLDFYIIDPPTMSGFSKEESLKVTENHNFKIKEIKKIETFNIKEILDKYNNSKFPDFLNLDAEGLEEIILSSIDFKTNYPKIICLETIEYSENGRGKKNDKIINFLENNGYIVYADTNINTIFVNKNVWK